MRTSLACMSSLLGKHMCIPVSLDFCEVTHTVTEIEDGVTNGCLRLSLAAPLPPAPVPSVQTYADLRQSKEPFFMSI